MKRNSYGLPNPRLVPGVLPGWRQRVFSCLANVQQFREGFRSACISSHSSGARWKILIKTTNACASAPCGASAVGCPSRDRDLQGREAARGRCGPAWYSPWLLGLHLLRAGSRALQEQSPMAGRRVQASASAIFTVFSIPFPLPA